MKEYPEADLGSESMYTEFGQRLQETSLETADAICRCEVYMMQFSKRGSVGAIVMQHALFEIFSTYSKDAERFRWIVVRFKNFGRGFGERVWTSRRHSFHYHPSG